MAIGKSGRQINHGKPADHGIVKASATHFKKIRHGTVRNRFPPARSRTRHANLGPVRSPGSFDREKLPVTGCRLGGCQVRHAPLQALRYVRRSAATKHLEYTDTLNKELRCIVFVLTTLFTMQRYTTLRTPWLKIFL